MSAERDGRLGRVGFVGLGNMGMPMARRLAAAGYHVCGFDTSAEIMRTVAALDGFSAAPGLTAVGDGASAVILSLPDSMWSSTCCWAAASQAAAGLPGAC